MPSLQDESLKPKPQHSFHEPAGSHVNTLQARYTFPLRPRLFELQQYHLEPKPIEENVKLPVLLRLEKYPQP